MKLARIATIVLAAVLGTSLAHANHVATLDELPLAGADTFWNGSDLSGGFTSAGIHFNNDYNTNFNSWSGFAYSNVDDTTTPEFDNQYAAFSGTDFSGEGNYAVGFYSSFDPQTVITLPQETLALGFYAVNTTYAGLSMQDGDDFAKQFTAEDEDWFLLTIEGFNTLGVSQGIVDFYLADFQSDDPADHYILADWAWVDLTALGDAVETLEFSLTSSDEGEFGMNTPAYFAMDNFTVVPEPSTVWLIGFGLAGLSLARRRHAKALQFKTKSQKA